jgi:anti-sigma regulatory factor (Ser/Thr protein kinase)
MNLLFESLPRSPRAAGTGRDLVHVHAAILAAQRRDDAVLMTSELITNALRHGTGEITLRIDVEEDWLRVEVSDEGNVRVAPSPEPGAHGGWGLRIVDQLADDWGVREGSTKVWFRLGGASANL